MANDGRDTPRICALSGCENPVPPSEEGGPPRRYCCGEHRVEARKRRYEARRAAAATVTAYPSGAGPRPRVIRRSAAAVRGTPALAAARLRPLRRHILTRNTLAMTALGALIAVTVPGDVGAGAPGDAAARGPREAGETPPVKVDLAWVPKARRTLRSVDENLSRIGSAEKAYASVAEDRRSPAVRGWMAELAVKKAELNSMKEVLRKGLEAVREYETSKKELDGIKHKLELVQKARTSLRELSDESRAAAGVRMDVLDRQIDDLERQTESVDGKVRGWGRKAQRAGQEPKTEPAPETGPLVDNVLRSTRPDEDHRDGERRDGDERDQGERGRGERGDDGDDRRGRDEERRAGPPPADRNPRPPEDTDKGDKHTEAPPNPGRTEPAEKPQKKVKRYVIVVPATADHPRITVTTTNREKALYLYQLARAAQENNDSHAAQESGDSHESQQPAHETSATEGGTTHENTDPNCPPC